MIWVVGDGVFHDALQRWGASVVTFDYLWFDTDLSNLSSIDGLTSYYIAGKKMKSSTGASPELEPYEIAVIKNAWSFANEVKIGDYVVLGCMGTMHVGRIAGPYAFDIDSRGKGVHSYPITQLENLVNKFQYPREIRHLFRDTGFGRIDDPAIERMLDSAVAGDVLPDASVAHLMFEEMSEKEPKRADVGELALDYTLELITEPEHCDTCQRVCTEVIHIDDNDGAINHPDGLFVPWSALYDLKERIQEELDNEGLERVPGESDLAMVRRYLDGREDGSHLASYNLEAGYPLLFGLRRGDKELWAWFMVHVDSSGYDASLTDWVFPSRELAEPFFSTLGFRKALDVDVARLEQLGFANPAGQNLQTTIS